MKKKLLPQGQKNIQMERKFPGIWLGIVCFISGIFMLLVYFNVIPSPESSFSFGRLPILFIGVLFAATGVYLILHNRYQNITKTMIPSIFGFIFYMLILAPFHVAAYKEYLNSKLDFIEFIKIDWKLMVIILLFDLLFVYIIFYTIYKRLKTV